MRYLLIIILLQFSSGIYAQGALSYTFHDNIFLQSLENTEIILDLNYGELERNTFDLLLPANIDNKPLVIFFHGGGFKRGNKEIAYERHNKGIRTLIENGIAFATVNYRYLQDSDDGVQSCLNDSKTCLQYIRLHAEEWGIDPTKISAFGESAGAGTSLWLALSDDMADLNSSSEIERESTRLFSAGAVSTQSTYDLIRWEEVFSDWSVNFSVLPGFMKRTIFEFYGADSYDELFNEHYTAYRSSLDFLKLLSEDDPNLWIQNTSGNGHPILFDPQHHPLHAAYLKKYADQNKVQNITYAPALEISDESGEDLLEFFIREFKEADLKGDNP